MGASYLEKMTKDPAALTTNQMSQTDALDEPVVTGLSTAELAGKAALLRLIGL